MSIVNICHRRLDYVNKANLIELKKQILFGSNKIEQLKFCEHYVQGKTLQIWFNIGQQRMKGVPNYVHVDL